MYARVTRWEGVDASAAQDFKAMIDGSDGPPPGVPSSGIMVLHDAGSSSALIIGLFDSEEDLRTGDAALRAMDRPPEARGDITAIESYEVTVDRRM